MLANYFFKYMLFFLLFWLNGNITFAANHYVRANATGTGDGSDWINAYQELPTTLIRDDTYFIATGSYPKYIFDDSMSGESFITIKKAVESDHGTDLGWQDSYGDGPAIFSVTSGTVWDFDSSYYDIDGVTGGGPSSWDSGHGFVVRNTDSHASSHVRGLINLSEPDGKGTISYIYIRHTEVDGTDPGTLEVEHGNTDGYYNIASFGSTSSKNNLIEYCWFHNFTRTMTYINNNIDMTIQYNLFEKRIGGYVNGAYIHGEIMSFNYNTAKSNPIIIRYNKFGDVCGTGIIVIKDSVQSGFEIYGNVFYQETANYGGSGSGNGVQNGYIVSTTDDTNTDIHIYNNTFVDMPNSAFGAIWFDNGSDNLVYNNIFYNCVDNVIQLDDNGNGSGNVHDYNAFSGDNDQNETHGQTGLPNVFENYSEDDFTLVCSTLPGYSAIGTEYPYDPNLKERGADGIWDRGAFEFIVTGSGLILPGNPIDLKAE